MLTQHGPKCDVCGKYIITDISINPFSVAGIDGTLLAHDQCRDAVIAAGKNWTQLPNGPLRQAFEGSVGAD
jgi:hypothetical protein